MTVLGRKNEDDLEMDGEKLKGGSRDDGQRLQDKLEREEHLLVPKRVYITREMLEELGFSARCPGCMSLLRRTAGQAHTEKCRKRMEAELKGTAKAEAAKRRMKEYTERVERQAKRTRSKTLKQKTQGETTGQTDEGIPAQGSGGSSSSGAMGANKPEDSEVLDRTDKKRQADEEHPEDPERFDGKWK